MCTNAYIERSTDEYTYIYTHTNKHICETYIYILTYKYTYR